VSWKRTKVGSDAVEPVGVVIDGHHILVIPDGPRWWAIEDRCSHAGCRFTEDGEIDGLVAICDCHGSEFDIRTGKAIAMPAYEPIRVYPVRTKDGHVEVGT
jgi:nitrite reductase/ring-hydroxylating ferredoxin subunit